MGKLLIYDETLLRARLRERRLRACALFLAGALCGFGLARSSALLQWARSGVAVISAAHAAAPDENACWPHDAPGLKLDCHLRQWPEPAEPNLAPGSLAR
ncbi:MAG: hypothetical protein IRZ06_07385 [Nevskia sp.]|nr:hypothetical protein [Nevskia sp.]